MKTITMDELANDLVAWMTHDARAIDMARTQRGDEDWEKWARMQFLQWQLTHGGRANVDYETERPNVERSRKFDIVYNRRNPVVDPNHPPIYSQWKCRSKANDAVSKIQDDIGTLTAELKATQADQQVPILPLLVVLCPEDVGFPEVVSITIPGCATRLHLSTPGTWRHYPVL
jgi:hypothetical protein